MAKKEQNQNAKPDEVIPGASGPVTGESDFSEGSNEAKGEEKDGESVEIPPVPSLPPESENKSEEKEIDSRRLKISALVSGQLFAAGIKASEIPPESLALIPSKYLEEMK